MERCPQPNPECRHFISGNCHLSDHHDFWPRRDYTTPVERAFRDLDENVEVLPRCEHDTVHTTEQPPEKPSIEIMAEAVSLSGMYLSRMMRKELRRIQDE